MDSNSNEQKEGALTVSDLGISPAQVAARGMSVVIPGEVYQAVTETFEVMLRVATMDPEARKIIENLQGHLLNNVVVVKPRTRLIEEAKTIPANLPGLPR